MKDKTNELFREYPMTIILVAIVIIVAVIGGIVTITNPDTLSFDQYINKLIFLAGAVSALGIGKAVKKGLIAQGTGVEPLTPALGSGDTVDPETDPPIVPPDDSELTEFDGDPPSDLSAEETRGMPIGFEKPQGG